MEWREAASDRVRTVPVKKSSGHNKYIHMLNHACTHDPSPSNYTQRGASGAAYTSNAHTA